MCYRQVVEVVRGTDSTLDELGQDGDRAVSDPRTPGDRARALQEPSEQSAARIWLAAVLGGIKPAAAPEALDRLQVGRFRSPMPRSKALEQRRAAGERWRRGAGRLERAGRRRVRVGRSQETTK